MKHVTHRIDQRDWRMLAISFAAALCIVGPAANAGRELKDADFSLRFPAAITRFASYADVAAMGNAQAASEWSSSINPASVAWRPAPGNSIIGFSPQFTTVRFAESTDLYVTSEALTIYAGDWGVFLPAAAQIRSNHAQDSFGLGFEFDAEFYQLQWGRRLGDDWAIGLNVNATLSETHIDVADLEVARSEGESYTFRLGVLHQLVPKVRIGLVLDYGFAPGRTDTLFVDPLTFLPGTVRTTDTTHQILVRVGASWEYLPGCNVYLDYLSGTFWNDTGTLQVHRFPVGIEHSLIKDILFARVGATFDTEGEVSASGGLGLALGAAASIDLAYQHNAFPEIRQEFGQAQSFVLSLSFGF